jgi:hypothetical protein
MERDHFGKVNGRKILKWTLIGKNCGVAGFNWLTLVSNS